jgi:cell pole-organizing protein PopZ
MNIAAPNPIPSQRSAADRQQETTMDEILASIRRIITEDQAVSASHAELKEPAAREPEKRYDQVSSMPNRTPEDIGSAVERLRRALDPNLSRAAPLTRPAEEPIPVPQAPMVQQPYGHSAPARTRQPLTDEGSDFSASHRTIAPPAMPAHSFERARNQPQMSFAKARAQRLAETRVPDQTLAQTQSPIESDAPKAAGPTSSLLSSEANASVAASFEALNKTLLAQNQDSFDNLARELMQPLLKQWLDDNLPTLVEKLVRAEIERVARGGRG